MINFNGSVTEGELKTKMVRDVRSAGGYARRFEDRYAVGLPDVFFAPKGVPGMFAEVKIIDGFKFAPTDRQYIELSRINEHNPFVYGIVIGWKKTFYFTENTRQADIRDCFSFTTHTPTFYEQLIQFYHARLKK